MATHPASVQEPRGHKRRQSCRPKHSCNDRDDGNHHRRTPPGRRAEGEWGQILGVGAKQAAGDHSLHQK